MGNEQDNPQGTVNCPKCGAENRLGAKFCRQCRSPLGGGASQAAPQQTQPAAPAQQTAPPVAPQPTAAQPGAVKCPNCGTENRAGAKFCRSCRASLEFLNSGTLSTDYVGLEDVRAKLEKIHNAIISQKKLIAAGARNLNAGKRILVFQGKTGTGKTTVANAFTKKLAQSGGLESGLIVTKWARDIKQSLIAQKLPLNETGVKTFLKDSKPGALIIDRAVEDPEFLHELILALARSEQTCLSVLLGLKEQFVKYFEKEREDEQLVSGFFDFPDQSDAELAVILKKQLEDKNFTLAENALPLLPDFVAEKRYDPKCRHKNGWVVENICLDAIEKEHMKNWEEAGCPPESALIIGDTDIPLKVRPKTVNEILAGLEEMVGMTEVKQTVREIANKVRYAKKLAEAQGKDYTGEGNHIVITGNPGTGKTTIVRTLAGLFKAIGVLQSDVPLEVQGNDLKAAYIGQSKDKVNQYCDDAMGRIFFIDEAYSLVGEQGPVDDFAKEAIDVLMARLENDRDKFVGVVAGYPREMETFIKKGNPGMERRFKHYITLPDYSADELIEIFERFNVQKEGYTLTGEARKKAREAIRDMVANKNERFGNAGTIRIFFERITSRLASRLALLSEEEQERLGATTIQAEDIVMDKKEAVPLDDVLADLDKMVGMKDVKKMVRELAENLKIQQERIDLEKAAAAERGEEYKPKTAAAERNNIIITGNPGTGKSTIVRTLAKLFYSIGLISSEKLVECQGNDLKGSYVGQSKDKVNSYCEKAMGGVLFVDEAYSLVNERGPVDDFATEAINILMARMENDGGKFICIAAGYEKEMGLFLDKSNPGMRSRFVHFLHLPDYSAEELFTIFENYNVKPAGLELTEEAREEAKKFINNMSASRGPNFGNAREMRELFMRITRRQSSRLNKLSPEERKEKINLIEAEDIRGPEDKVLSVNEILSGLDALTGMAEVKKAVRDMAQKIRMQKEREEKARADALARGEKWEPRADQKQGNHIVLTGNPGTGKTTVVRRLAQLFKAIGALPTDKLIERNGNDLKGSFIGQSKDRVNEACREAMGGVLFVDEAYVLANEQGPVDSYAKEAADTLLTHLENEKDTFICIVAGYEKEMGLFLDKLNPGMRSRFNHYLSIADYRADELFEIFEGSFMKSANLTLTPEAREAAKKAIDTMVRKKRPDFGNAREIRRFFEEVTGRQSARLAALPDEERTLEAHNTVEAADIGETEKSVSIDDVLADLDAMVGMKEVKETVRGIAVKLAYQKKIMEQTGKAPDAEGNHIVITGNPGTGKTTIVRSLGKLFKAVGLLANDKPLEIQGNDLKGSYMGQSKDKVNEYCRQALGGMLFIDEAYALVNDRGAIDQFAQEAIDVLMAHLENERDKFVGVVAGYPREMDTFIKKSNPGMERRFKHYIQLPDYSAEELFEIFERFNVKKAGYTLSDAAREKAREAIRTMVANKGPTFGNAGAVRTFFEKITGNTASRVSKLPEENQCAVLQVIEAEDIPE